MTATQVITYSSSRTEDVRASDIVAGDYIMDPGTFSSRSRLGILRVWNVEPLGDVIVLHCTAWRTVERTVMPHWTIKRCIAR